MTAEDERRGVSDPGGPPPSGPPEPWRTKRPRDARPVRLPERAALEKVLRGTGSSQAALRELLGERQLWWRCCREAVQADPSWLFDGRGGRVHAGLRATVADHAAGALAIADHAWQLGRSLASEDPQDHEVLAGLVRAWHESGLVSADAAPGPAAPSGRGLEGLSPQVAGALRSVARRIPNHHGVGVRGSGPAAGVLVIAALLMAGAEPRPRPAVRVPVVFGRSAGLSGPAPAEEGVTGVLELREFPAGPAGLYPDPRTMAGVRSPNSQFATALGHAWGTAGRRGAGRCVLWRLVLSDDPVPPARIEGPSLGAAFALGLREVLRYPASRRPGLASVRGVFRGLRPRTAVTGALDGGERLLRVADLDAKLLAARRKGWRLVAPEANRLDVAAAPEPGDVRFAADLGQADRYARRFRLGRLAVAALVLVASSAGGVALQQRDAARSEQRAALVGRLTAEANQLRGTDPSLAAQLDLAAFRMLPGTGPYANLVADGNAILSTATDAHRLLVDSVAYRPQGDVLASAGEEGTIKLWSLADRARPSLLGEPLTGSGLGFNVTFGPDGRLLAAGGYHQKVRLWNLAEPAHPQDLGQPIDADGAPAFSPDGRTLATDDGGDHTTVRLWNIGDGAHPTAQPQVLTGKTGYAVSLAFGPDGRTLAAAGNDNTVRLWNLARPSQAPALLDPQGAAASVHSLAFSPDGRTLATADDGRVWLWNLTDPDHPALLPHFLNSGAGSAVKPAFGPDGRTLAVGGDNGIRLWDLSDPSAPAASPQVLTAAGGVRSLAFGPDGRTLAAGSADGRITVYSLPGRSLPVPAGQVTGLAFSPDGRLLATGGEDGTLRLWSFTDSAGPGALGQARTGARPVYDLAFGPDGRTLATGDLDGILRLWDVADPANPRATGPPLPVATGAGPLALSPDGRTLAAGSGSHVIRVWSLADPAHPEQHGAALTDVNLVDRFAVGSDGHTVVTNNGGGTVKLWDTADPAHPREIGTLGPGGRSPEPLAFSPDGRFVASARNTATAVWSVADPVRPVALGSTSARSDVASLAFGPGGQVLASGGEDGTIRFIDPVKPASPNQPLAAHAGSVFALAFSPDGHTLASSATDRAVRLWNTDPDAAARWICATTRSVTADQWKQHVPGAPYQPPCP
ncbi:hypothetical protein GCM10010495_44400 [Kitasatospora herbaricolor]|nr:hypothetical protein GCM10010495_44400 [Kitasatospora herbaricolor]